jgi:hypothetical protein
LSEVVLAALTISAADTAMGAARRMAAARSAVGASRMKLR